MTGSMLFFVWRGNALYYVYILQDLWQGIDFSRSKAEARVDVSI